MRTFSAVMNNETTPLLRSGLATLASLHQNKKCQDIVSYTDTHPAKPSPVGPLEITPLSRRLILAGVWLSIFIASLNSALIATLLTPISSELHATDQASWLGTSYLLATCTFTPLYGRLCDILGRRRASQLALFLAALSIILSVVSNSMTMLVASQFISGVGGGGSFITTVIITSDMYILRHRGWIQGLSAVICAAGQGIAGPLGGYISEQFGWRWAFLFQLPFYVLAILMIESNLHYVVPGKSEGTKDILKNIDYGGTISLMLSIFSFLVFLSFKYTAQLPFTEPRVLASLLFTIIMAIIFAYFELCIATQPILAPSLLKQMVPVLVGISGFITAINDVTSLYFLPLFFERVMLTSTATAGSHILPKSVAMTLGSLIGGAIISGTGSFKMLGILAACTTLIGNVMLFLATLNEKSSFLVQWFGIVPLGLGNTIIVQTMTIALLAHVEPSQMAIALGFAQLWRSVGQVAGVAIPSAIFQQLIGRELAARITGPGAEKIIEIIRASARNVHDLPYELRRHACDSYGVALRQVFWFLALLIFAAVLIQIAIPNRSLTETSEELPKPNRS